MAALLFANPVITPDTFDYVRQSRLPLFSAAFWGSQHPPLVPLLWKFIPGLATSASPPLIGDVTPALVLNVLVGTACWGFLAYTAGSMVRTSAIRAVVVLVIVALSLSPDVAGWDAAALSESISVSLVALVLALALRYATDPRRRHAVWLGVAILAASLARDTNLAYCALAVAPLLLALPRHRAPVVAAILVAGALSLWGQSAGNRSAIPTRNAIAGVLAHADATPWFRAHGMPWQRGVVGVLIERPPARFDADPRAAALRRWLDAHGRTTWLVYLGTHPDRTLELTRNLGGIYDPPRSALAPYWGGTAPGWFPRGVLFAALAITGVLGAALSRRRPAALVLSAFLTATLPLAVLIWDADALEFDRHAVVIPVFSRVALVALTLVLADAVYTRGWKAAVNIPKYVGAS